MKAEAVCYVTGVLGGMKYLCHLVDWLFAAARPLSLKVSFAGNKQPFYRAEQQAIRCLPLHN